MAESPTVIAEGTQTAVIGTEHTLATDTTGKTYLLVVDGGNNANGDTLELRIYTKVRSTSTERLAYYEAFSNVLGEPNLYSVPVPADVSFKATLKQTAGTGRDFDWKVLAL